MSNAHIEYCIVHHNTAYRDGAGIRAVTCIPILNNNTISRNQANMSYGHGGGLEGNFTGVNNIIYGNFAALSPEIYDGYFMFTYTCCATSISGTGNITSNPLWVDPDNGNFNLQPASPCIDTGSPTWPLDPDSTRADMGALYFNQSAPPVSITLDPVNPPIQIPAGGGSFSFDATLHNNESAAQTFDVWIMIQLPNSAWFGPALGPLTLTLPPNFSLVRQRTQTVPGTAPAGNYWYQGRIGDYPSVIGDSSGFPFSKSATGDETSVCDWKNDGQGFDHDPEAQQAPLAFSLQGAYPNPFNARTTIGFLLPRYERISLRIFNISGALAATLIDGWRDAGFHEVTVDATGWVSGVYFYQIKADDQAVVGKFMLMK